MFFVSLIRCTCVWVGFERQEVGWLVKLVYPILGLNQVNMYLRSIVVSLILYSYTVYNGTGMVRV